MAGRVSFVVDKSMLMRKKGRVKIVHAGALVRSGKELESDPVLNIYSGAVLEYDDVQPLNSGDDHLAVPVMRFHIKANPDIGLKTDGWISERGRGVCDPFPIAGPVSCDEGAGYAEAPERSLSMKGTISMAQGEVAALPDSIQRVFLGCGWEGKDAPVDLDTSVVLMDGSSPPNRLNVITYNNTSAPGVTHSGDNTQGAAGGDNETIRVDTSAIASNTQSLVFTVNIYSSGKSYRDVKNAYMRLVAEDGSHELARYPLDATLTTRGMLFAKLERGRGGWKFIALGIGCEGQGGASDEVLQAIRSVS